MKSSDIKLRLYRSVLVLGIVLSALNIIGNFISGFPITINIKWVILLGITITAFFISKNEKYSKHVMFVMFLALIGIFLPLGYIASGGGYNNVLGYYFLMLIVTTYIFIGWKRILLAVLLIFNFILMHILEYVRPEIINVYEGYTPFTDRLIQIPLLLFASFLIIQMFAKEYEKIHNKLEVYASYDELNRCF